jgi:hypothetical protein
MGYSTHWQHTNGKRGVTKRVPPMFSQGYDGTPLLSVGLSPPHRGLLCVRIHRTFWIGNNPLVFRELPIDQNESPGVFRQVENPVGDVLNFKTLIVFDFDTNFPSAGTHVVSDFKPKTTTVFTISDICQIIEKLVEIVCVNVSVVAFEIKGVEIIGEWGTFKMTTALNLYF